MQQKQPMVPKHSLKIQFYPDPEEECLEDGFVMLVDLRTKPQPTKWLTLAKPKQPP